MIYRFGDCILDTNLCTLERGGQTFRLRLKVFRMCLYLLEHRDRVVSREELCAQVWPGQFVSQATLEGVIRLVRQAVGDSGRTQASFKRCMATAIVLSPLSMSLPWLTQLARQCGLSHCPGLWGYPSCPNTSRFRHEYTEDGEG